VAYVGATAPRLGVFVIDSDGPPRAFVGPIARAYEVQGPIAARYTDETARALGRRDEPWAASYTIAAPPSPPSLQLDYDAASRRLVLTSDSALGPATIKALDHHRVAIATARATVKRGETKIPIKTKGVSGFYVELGDFRDFVVEDAYGEIHGQWGRPPPGR
jgi:hypothetical protein